jgi:hypothetical protein
LMKPDQQFTVGPESTHFNKLCISPAKSNFRYLTSLIFNASLWF